jgi:glycosyltransferase 2 family protein
MGKQNLHRIRNSIDLAKLRLKPLLRYCILGATFLFIAKAFVTHWREIALVKIRAESFPLLVIALGITLLSLMFAGGVWRLILREFRQPASAAWAVQVFLRTNIAKYLPGNIWHFWGRISVAKNAGIVPKFAILSVVLEPLLMAAAGLLIGLVFLGKVNWLLRIIGMAAILTAIHPRLLNPIVLFVERLKLSKSNHPKSNHPNLNVEHLNVEHLNVEQFAGDRLNSNVDTVFNIKQKASFVKSKLKKNLPIKRYPVVPLIGEMCFIGLRGSGFLLTVMALIPVHFSEIPNLFGGFCFAFVAGLVVPGAPGGMGVFEATAIALLSDRFSVGVILSAVALYRIISIIADVVGAVLAKVQGEGDRRIQ